MVDNISHYESFLAVAECSSVSEAAKKLFVSQPAVSAEIAALERSLKVKLFFRTNRGMSLTPEGKALYDYIKKGFSFIIAGEEKMREISELKSGVLRIGASDMTLRFFLLDYIESFRNQYPDVHLTVTNAPTPQTIEALRSGRIDFGVVSEPINTADEGDIEFIPVREINDIFICAPSCELAGRAAVKKQELCEYPMIMLERNTSTRRYVSSWLGSDFPTPAIELATSDLILEFAERGIGVCSIVEDFAKHSIAQGKVVKIDMAESLPPRRFFVACLRRLPPSAASKKMLDMLRGVEH